MMFILGSLVSLLDFLVVSIELFSLGVTSEVLRAKIDRKSAISLQRGQFDQKFQVEGLSPHQSFSYRKLCSRLSSSHFTFLIPLWGLRGNV